jgi:hypothetical protein
MCASVVVRIVGIPFHVLSLFLKLGRTLIFLHHAYLAGSGINHGNWLTFCRVVSLGDPSRRMFDDGAGMHEYLFCTILDCGTAC